MTAAELAPKSQFINCTKWNICENKVKISIFLRSNTEKQSRIFHFIVYKSTVFYSDVSPSLFNALCFQIHFRTSIVNPMRTFTISYMRACAWNGKSVNYNALPSLKYFRFASSLIPMLCVHKKNIAAQKRWFSYSILFHFFLFFICECECMHAWIFSISMT